MQRPLTALTVPFAAYCLSAAPSFADVLVVGSGPGASYANPADAIAAAADGDVVLVRPGSYPGFTIDDKAVAVVADGASVRLSSPVTVSDLAAGRTATLSGLHIRPTAPAGTGALRITNCDGAVRILSCDVDGFTPAANTSCSGTVQGSSGSRGCLVSSSNDVAIVGTDIAAGAGQDVGNGSYSCYGNGGNGGDGLYVSSSRVALFRSLFHGGEGGYGPCAGLAGDGAVVAGSSVVSSNYCLFEGGVGGCSYDFICPCTDGGTGLLVQAPAEFHDLGGVLIGGPPASFLCGHGAGLAGSGAYHTMSGFPYAALTPELVRSGSTWEVEVFGPAGHDVHLRFDAETQFGFRPVLGGAWLLPASAAMRVGPSGTIPQDGRLVLQLQAADLPLGMESSTLWVQAIVTPPGGEPKVSSPSSVLLLDGGF